MSGLIRHRRADVPCTVEVSHPFEALHAHVRFDDGSVMHPGDEVQVHGAPVLAAYGEVAIERRTATITRATLLERVRTRMTGDLEFMELCEFSFSEESRLRTHMRNSTASSAPTRARRSPPSSRRETTAPRWRRRRRCCRRASTP